MDLKNQRELAKLISFCRKQGITSLKSGDFEVQLAPTALFPESAYKKKQNESDTIETEPVYDGEAALFWSSAGIPEDKEAN